MSEALQQQNVDRDGFMLVQSKRKRSKQLNSASTTTMTTTTSTVAAAGPQTTSTTASVSAAAAAATATKSGSSNKTSSATKKDNQKSSPETTKTGRPEDSNPLSSTDVASAAHVSVPAGNTDKSTATLSRSARKGEKFSKKGDKKTPTATTGSATASAPTSSHQTSGFVTNLIDSTLWPKLEDEKLTKKKGGNSKKQNNAMEKALSGNEKKSSASMEEARSGHTPKWLAKKDGPAANEIVASDSLSTKVVETVAVEVETAEVATVLVTDSSAVTSKAEGSAVTAADLVTGGNKQADKKDRAEQNFDNNVTDVAAKHVTAAAAAATAANAETAAVVESEAKNRPELLVDNSTDAVNNQSDCGQTDASPTANTLNANGLDNTNGNIADSEKTTTTTPTTEDNLVASGTKRKSVPSKSALFKRILNKFEVYKQDVKFFDNVSANVDYDDEQVCGQRVAMKNGKPDINGVPTQVPVYSIPSMRLNIYYSFDGTMKSLRLHLCHVIESLFDETHFQYDNFLKCYVDENNSLPLQIIASHREIQKLTNDLNLVISSISLSPILKMSSTDYRVRRTTDETPSTAQPGDVQSSSYETRTSQAMSACGTGIGSYRYCPMPELHLKGLVVPASSLLSSSSPPTTSPLLA